MAEDKKDKESEVLMGLFEEIMKMVRQKQVRLETIVQRAIEQEIVSHESFNRLYAMLSEYGKKKQWV